MGGKRFAEECFTIGELARHTDVNVETIRYYERIGLLPRPPRTRGGHRTFNAEICRSLAFIKRARELGFGLDDVRALLSLRDSQGSCTDVRAVAARHLKDVRAKIEALSKLEGELARTIASCPDDDSTDCPVLERLDSGPCRQPSP